jgi:TonB-dependent Receptor Plug Domain
MKYIIITLIILYKSTAGLAQKSNLDSLVKSSPKLPTVMEFKTKDGTIINSGNIVITDKSKTGLDDSKKLIYMMDGKRISEIELKGIDPKDIEKLDVYKGEKAVVRYGEDARDGAIVITLKKK